MTLLCILKDSESCIVNFPQVKLHISGVWIGFDVDCQFSPLTLPAARFEGKLSKSAVDDGQPLASPWAPLDQTKYCMSKLVKHPSSVWWNQLNIVLFSADCLKQVAAFSQVVYSMYSTSMHSPIIIYVCFAQGRFRRAETCRTLLLLLTRDYSWKIKRLNTEYVISTSIQSQMIWWKQKT